MSNPLHWWRAAGQAQSNCHARPLTSGFGFREREATMIATTMRLLAIAMLLAMPQIAVAQSPPAPAPTPAAPAPADQLLKPEQLDALVAPIALYPDPLLAEIFMASTYPLEVVEAERWVKANKNLKGDALKAAVDKQSWDDSVRSLIATPAVLDMMSDQLDWTQALGNAVLAQQPDVLAAVQRLRAAAQANNKLASTPQQTVTSQQQASGPPVIVIQPTQPDTIYVPYYDPGVVYGAWPYPAYPPYYWPAPGYIAGGIIATGIAFGAGYALGHWAGGGYRWGGGVGWGGNNIYVNRSVNVNNVGNSWTHNPVHRQGVRYNNANVAAKFGGSNLGGAQGRADFRGKGGGGLQAGAGNLGGGNVGAGNRPAAGAANRPAAGAANRPAAGAANRPGAGAANRAAAGAANRPAAGGAGRPGGNAMGNVGSGRAASAESARGHASLGAGGGGGRGGGGGGAAAARGGGGGGGAARGGGGGGGAARGGGGGRRSDLRLKHDVAWLGHLDNGLGFYRFVYNGGHTAYVGVMAQEVQAMMPEAVIRGSDGYLRVYYEKLGVKFQSYDEWLTSGARVPTGSGLVAQ
jgi:hypothetical protein